MTQPVLMGKKQPDFPASALWNSCTQKTTTEIKETMLTYNVFCPVGSFRFIYSAVYVPLVIRFSFFLFLVPLTLAEGTIHFFLVLWDRCSARGCQFSLPQSLCIFGALAHFLVVKLHLADVQLISARCNRMYMNIYINISIKSDRLIFNTLKSIKDSVFRKKKKTRLKANNFEISPYNFGFVAKNNDN